MNFLQSIIKLFYRNPDEIIGRSGPDIYLRRWCVIPKNPICNIYLHNFLLSDIGNHLHNHKWLFNASLIIKGSYLEHLPKNLKEWHSNNSREEIVVKRYPFVPIFRYGESIHRIELFNDNKGPMPVWTLFITGPDLGISWGFYCPNFYRDHKEYLADTDESISITGKGCD